MTDRITFTPPVRATSHCRHYSFDLMSDSVPQCALGLDPAAPGIVVSCWSVFTGDCPKRQEYTDRERAAWQAWTRGTMDRLGAAVSALPAPIPLNRRGAVTCPSCGGVLHYGRWHRGASIQCETDHCCAARFNIAAGVDWPEPETGSM